MACALFWDSSVCCLDGAPLTAPATRHSIQTDAATAERVRIMPKSEHNAWSRLSLPTSAVFPFNKLRGFRKVRRTHVWPVPLHASALANPQSNASKKNDLSQITRYLKV